jgi:hypothetical protein
MAKSNPKVSLDALILRADFSRDVEKKKWFAEDVRELSFIVGDI